MNSRDIGMVERGQDFGLTLETAEALSVVGELIRQRFNGNVTFKLRISGTIHFAHTALP